MSYDLVDHVGRLILAVAAGFGAAVVLCGLLLLVCLAWKFRSCKG
jgi:hypothetical protein